MLVPARAHRDGERSTTPITGAMAFFLRRGRPAMEMVPRSVSKGERAHAAAG